MAASSDRTNGHDGPGPDWFAPDLEPDATDAEAAWPEPMAEAGYHGVLGEAAQAMAPHTEADPVGILASLLVAFGVACGDHKGTYQGGLHRPKLQAVLVGPTNAGRKGTAWDVARAIMAQADHTLGGLIWTGVASGEGIPKHLAREVEQAEKEGREPEYRALLLETELGGLLVKMGREGNTLSPTLRMAWDDQPLGNIKSREGSMVTRHHLGLLGHITPAELHATLRTVDAANGFANRMLFLAVRRVQLLPFPEHPSKHTAALAPRILAALDDAHGSVGWLELAEEGRAWWQAFYLTEQGREPLGLAGAVTARGPAQVIRLALVYALADRAPAIYREHLEAAHAVAEYARRSAVWVFGSSTGSRRADTLLRLLRGNGAIGWTDAKRAMSVREAGDMLEAVDLLQRQGLVEVRREPRPGGGAPAQTIELVARS